MDRALPQAYDSADPVDPTAETVINAVPHVMGGGGRESDDRPDAPVSPIKGRLVTAANLYLAAQRDTVGG
jgi:hypothetical protein